MLLANMFSTFFTNAEHDSACGAERTLPPHTGSACVAGCGRGGWKSQWKKHLSLCGLENWHVALEGTVLFSELLQTSDTIYELSALKSSILKNRASGQRLVLLLQLYVATICKTKKRTRDKDDGTYFIYKIS